MIAISLFWSHVIAEYKQRSDRDQKLIEASPSDKTKSNWLKELRTDKIINV